MSGRPDIEQVWEHYGRRIVGRGDWAKAQCPLLSHEDKNASASVNIESGKWQCFSCGEHGDAYDVIGRNEGLAGFADAKRWAEKQFGVSDRSVPGERVGRGGLSVRPRNRGEGGSFVPPWRRSL